METRAAVAHKARLKPFASTDRKPARCLSKSEQPVYATPMNTLVREPTPRVCSRQYSGMKARAWSSMSVPVLPA